MPIRNKVSHHDQVSKSAGIFIGAFFFIFASPCFLLTSAAASTCEALFAEHSTKRDERASLARPSTLDFYNAHAAEYDATRAHVSPELEKQRLHFLSQLPKGARILEIGAGHGRDALYFQEQGFEVVATEPSVELARIAELKIGRPVLKVKAQDIAFVREFDAVWAAASLIHVPPQELATVFRNLKRAVKLGGIIHASFLKGVGTEDVPEQILDGRYFNRASERHLRDVVNSIGGLTIIENLSRGQSDDYFGSAAPTTTFGFYNLYLRRDR